MPFPQKTGSVLWQKCPGIFKLLVTYVNSDLKELIENNVKVQVLGDYSTLPKDAVKSLEKTLEETKDNTGLQFNIALNYGGRDEIRRSVQTLAEKVAQGALQPEEITEDMIGAELFTGSSHADSPDRADHPHQRRRTAFKFPAVA